MKTLLLIQEIVLFGLFIWAAMFFFKLKDTKNAKIRAIKILGFATIAANIYFLAKVQYVNGLVPILASVLLFLSFWIFLDALWVNRKAKLGFAFDTQIRSESVVKSGVYGFMRHPIYTSYILGWLGGAVAAQSFLLVVPIVILAILYFQSAAEEEAMLLSGPLADEYRAYQATTGRFLPRIKFP